MITQQSSEIVSHRLERLAAIYRQCQASELMDKTLDKLFDYEAETCRAQIRDIEKDLSFFEQQYGQSSDLFYQSFQEGKTDDRLDFVEWASIVQMVERLKNRLELLTAVEKNA